MCVCVTGLQRFGILRSEKRGEKLDHKKGTKQIWILLAERFPTVVSKSVVTLLVRWQIIFLSA